MMTKLFHHLLATILVLLFAQLSAQTEAAKIYLLADPQDRGVALRWGYADAATFARARANGVRLLRTDADGGNPVELLSAKRPNPLESWAASVDTSDFAAVLAQMLYGTTESSGDPELDREQAEAAFGMTFYAADHDFDAARAAALGYLDEQVGPANEYRYELTIVGADNTPPVRLAVNSALRIPRPAPKNPRGAWRDETVELRWNREATDTLYTSYYVERAGAQNNNWVRLNRLPLVQILNEENYDSLQYFTDKAVVPTEGYRYRFYGMTPFGRFGPKSAPITVAALEKPLVGAPVITTMIKVVDSLYRVEWEAGAGFEKDVVSYRVESSRDPFGTFQDHTGPLAPGTRQAVLTNPTDGAYVRVVVTDVNGLTATSVAKILRVFDLIPPAPPTGLTGSVDSLGNVTISWADNREADLSGYRVYVANRPRGYFPQLTEKEVKTATFADKVTMDTRAEKVYYKVKAVDYTGNYSEFSETLMLERPDFRPPSPPVVRSVRGSESGVRLETAFSSSDDVEYHLLERRDDTDWVTIDTIRTTAKSSWVTDTTGERGQVYDYRVVAVDDAELRSFTEVVTGGKTDNGLRAPITDFSASLPEGTRSFTLQWRYPAGQNLRGFQLYRAAGGGQLQTYQFLTSASPELKFRNGRFLFFDTDANRARYTYQMMAVHHDGGHSPLTPALTVSRPN